MKLRRITAFVLSSLLMILNLTNIVIAAENPIKVGQGEKVGIVETIFNPTVMTVEDTSIAKIIWEQDTRDAYKWKVMVEGLKAGVTTASIQLVGDASPKNYSIEVIDGSTVPPTINGIQRINANNLVWTPVSDNNQLGGADDFSGIFFNEFKNFNESGGAIAARKISDVKISTFDEGLIGSINQFNDIVIPKFNVGLIAQESIGGSSNIVISNGDAVIGTNVDTKKLDMKDGGIYKKQAQIDNFLDIAKNDLIRLNNDLWSKEKTEETVYDKDTITLNLVKGINVFEVDFSSGRKNINFNYVDADAKESTIIIKVKGSVVNYNSTLLNGNLFSLENTDNLANRVIWTFDPSIKGNTTDIEIKNTVLCGFLLAPNANIAFTSGYCAINGNIIANGLDAINGSTNSELHWVGPFKGRLNSVPIEKTGSFQFNKKDNNGSSVKGAEFQLLQNNQMKYTTTSIDTGIVSFSSIKEGVYTLKETKAPDGYEISKAEVEVTVDSNGLVIFKENGVVKTVADLDLLYINNVIKTKISFSFNKVIAGTNTGIPDVEFKLIQGNKEITTVKSNANGAVNFSNIELGNYSLVEITPAGYKQAGPWTVNITKDGAYIDGKLLDKIENEKIIEKVGSFQFNKKDNYGNIVKGAEFTLYQDGKVKYTVNSNDKGLVYFNDIKEGTYTLMETNTPNGYEISKAVIEVIVNSDGTVTFRESGVVKTIADLEELYINKMILGSISFTKYIDDKKGTLAGAEFELLINGERYGATVFSDANGLVTFLNVKPGEYKIREVGSHSNYFKASNKVIDVAVDNKGVSSLVGQAKIDAETMFINKVENSIQFIKYSDNNSVLSNAIFELLKGKEVIATSISDKNGVVRFNNILPGEYIVHEKSAPKGYIKSDATKKLVVKDNGEILITNSEIKEWEEAFKNKIYKSEVDSINDNNNNKTLVPQTSDNSNAMLPLLAAILSLSAIAFMKKAKH